MRGEPGGLRSGRISYTNDLPIYAAFDAGAVLYPGELVANVPAELNRMLVAGELALSPISAFAYAAHAELLALLPEICIGSRAEVWSVLCASPRPLAELAGATIAVTRESASGRNLLRVLLERRYGVRAAFATVDDPLAAAIAGRPALLIGDRAIDARERLPAAHVYDLGRLWHEWTGLDMVYAVWAVRRDALAARPTEVDAALEALVTARAWGAAHPEAVTALAQAQHPRPASYYPAYYATLNFTFDAAARTGLRRFFEELHAVGAVPRIASSEPEVSRVSR